MGMFDIFKSRKEQQQKQKEQQARIIAILQPTREKYPIFEQALQETGIKADIDEGKIPANVQVKTSPNGQIDIIYRLGEKLICISFRDMQTLMYDINKIDCQQKNGMSFFGMINLDGVETERLVAQEVEYDEIDLSKGRVKKGISAQRNKEQLEQVTLKKVDSGKISFNKTIDISASSEDIASLDACFGKSDDELNRMSNIQSNSNRVLRKISESSQSYKLGHYALLIELDKKKNPDPEVDREEWIKKYIIDYNTPDETTCQNAINILKNYAATYKNNVDLHASIEISIQLLKTYYEQSKMRRQTEKSTEDEKPEQRNPDQFGNPKRKSIGEKATELLTDTLKEIQQKDPNIILSNDIRDGWDYDEDEDDIYIDDID